MAIKPSGFLRPWMPASKSSLPSPHDSVTCSEIPTISQSNTEVSFDVASEHKGYFWLCHRLLLPGCCWPDLHPTTAFPGQEHLGSFDTCCKHSPARALLELLTWGAPSMFQNNFWAIYQNTFNWFNGQGQAKPGTFPWGITDQVSSDEEQIMQGK